jgi:tRNA-specific 2-thiouridylase
MNKKVIVAMSGGVDSTVSALILKNKGYNVQGIFLDFFNDRKKVEEIKLIADSLDVPIKIINASKDFKRIVVSYFLDELRKGRTPNPCVVCNKEIKFRILFEKMLSFKADRVATGHYARRRREVPNPKSKISNRVKILKSKYFLSEAKDKSKDQSYFLYKLSQKELSRILFPLGNYTKKEVREMAKKFGLPVYNKEESQDICFIPEKGYNNFLRKMLKLKKGKIVDLESNVLGIHEGLPFYTIGQRKGIKLGGNGPYYVIEKDFGKNRLVVGSEKELFSKNIVLKDINWIIKKPKFPFKTLIRTRYRSPLSHAIIKTQNEKRKTLSVIFEKPQRAVTPGQSAVFYLEKGEVLGGGTIG